MKTKVKMSQNIDSRKNDLLESFLKQAKLSPDETNLLRLALCQDNHGMSWKEFARLADFKTVITAQNRLAQAVYRFKYSFARRENTLKEELRECKERLKSQDEIIQRSKALLAQTTLLDPSDFGMRIQSWLKHNPEIKTLADLTSLTKKQILRYRNMGRKSLKEIEMYLEYRGGFELRQD